MACWLHLEDSVSMDETVVSRRLVLAFLGKRDFGNIAEEVAALMYIATSEMLTREHNKHIKS